MAPFPTLQPKSFGIDVEVLPFDVVISAGDCVRSWRLKEYAAIAALILSAPTFGGICHIDILNEKNSGEKIRFQFKTKLQTKKQCQALAKMHRPNFNPDQVKLKLVNYNWKGPDDLIAKRTKSHKRRRLPKF